jgi:formylglycine-generating enzyme required for sulfatase activity
MPTLRHFFNSVFSRTVPAALLALAWIPPGLSAADAKPATPPPRIDELFPAGYFVAIPAGEFLMGTPQATKVDPAPGRSPWTKEQPQHHVTLAGFEMGKFEITQRQWAAVMGRNPSFFRGLEGHKEEHASGMVYATAVMSKFESSLDQPVEQISWKQAHEFVDKLNVLDPAHVYRLPTEAEWEYACRAGTTGDYPGDLDKVAWYYSREEAFNKPQPHPVGQKAPNAWGLYDMLGNVWEWCEDPWHTTYVGAHEDGSVWLNARSTDGNYADNRVLRGGSWLNRAADCRPASRWYGVTAFTNNFIGVRLVRTANPSHP